MKNTGINPEDCPTPEYHSTHRYCPSCDWDETMDKITDTMNAAPGEFVPKPPEYDRVGHITLDNDVDIEAVHRCSACHCLVIYDAIPDHTTWHTG